MTGVLKMHPSVASMFGDKKSKVPALGDSSGFVLCNLCLMLQQNLVFVSGSSKV